MAREYKNFLQGISIIPKTESASDSKGELEFLTSNNKLHIHNGTLSDPIVSETITATLSNKTLTSPILNTPTVNTITGIAGGSLTIQSASNQNVVIQSQGTGIVLLQSATDQNVSIQAQGTGNVLIEGISINGTVISSASMANGSGTFTFNTSGAITAPNGTDTLAGISLSQTLTNKTIAAGSNTITGLTNTNLSGSAAISNANLANSSITINGSSVSLGGSTTVTANTTNTLTIGTGLSGTSFNGSSAVTIAIDSTVVTLTGSQALSNKTLTSPIINTSTADTITGIAGGALTVQSASNQNLSLNAQGGGVLNLQKGGTSVAQIDTALVSLLDNAELRLREATGNGTEYVGVKASSSISASYTITLPSSAPTANTTIVYDGSNYIWSSAGGWSSSVQTTLSAGGTVTISLTQGQQAIEVAGNGAAVTLSNTPFGSSAPSDKVVIRLVGRSNTNTVSLVNIDSAKGVLMNGNATLALGDVIEFMYLSSIDRYVECYRNF